MGASNSRVEEDKGLQLCRARKKFIKQALNGRCSLAAAHIAYIQHLKIIGAALTRFVEPQLESFVPEPHALIDMSQSTANVSSPVSSQFHSHPMKFRGTIQEKPHDVSTFEATSIPSDAAPPWDYFGLLENQFSGQERRVFDKVSDCSDEMRHIREEEGIPDLEDSQESEDEFDEPSTVSLVRRFKNVNTIVDGDSAIEPSESVLPISETKFAPIEPSESLISETKFGTPAESSGFVHLNEDKVAPKDLFSSISDIEQLFVKASESGKEVPRMLEANKFRFRPLFPGNQRASSFLKSCLSLGKDPTPSEVQQEPPQNSVNYLTWHRTTSFHSASSRNLLTTNSTDDTDNNLFEKYSCMVSGSHTSTLDRLYAWENKLYDEVKGGQVLKSNFDKKCKLLREKESRGVNADRTRGAVKDLHSRMRVAIHRINSISKKIEEIRDMELQPQLEELIQGLRKMWEMMVECHKLQFHIISNSRTNTKMQLDSQRQITINLGYQLSSLSSSFAKWISAQKIYVEAIDKWLFKCVFLRQNPSKRNKRMKPPLLRNCGPPIYMVCGAWLEMMPELPHQGVADSIKELAAQAARFLPRQPKSGDPNNIDLLFEDRMLLFQTRLAAFLGQLNSFAECSLKMYIELQKAIQDAKTKYQH